jgi:hypothetical protein
MFYLVLILVALRAALFLEAYVWAHEQRVAR